MPCVRFCQEIYIDKNTIPAVAMREDVPASDTAFGHVKQLFGGQEGNITVIRLPPVGQSALKPAIQDAVAGHDPDVPAEHRVALGDQPDVPAKYLLETQPKEVIPPGCGAKRRVGRRRETEMSPAHGLDDQCQVLESHPKHLFQLLAEQGCKQAVEGRLDGLVDPCQPAVFLSGEDAAEERPVLRVLRDNTGKKGLCSRVLPEENIESQSGFLNGRSRFCCHGNSVCVVVMY